MLVYFVRHGESNFNASGRFQHGQDSLSPSGIKQAKTVARRFAHVDIDLIISSPFIRARRTAEIINAVVHKPIEFNDCLVENKAPTEIVGREWHDPEAVKITQQLEAGYEDPNFRFSDEETFWDIKQRALSFINDLEQVDQDDVLVVTHGMILKMIIGVMIYGEGLTPRMFRPFNAFFGVSNTGVTLCQQDNHGRWQVVTWNDQNHLKEMVEDVLERRASR